VRGTLSTGESLARLHELLEREGGELAAALVPLADPQRENEMCTREAFGPLVASCERGLRSPVEYALLVEAICEGYLLHYWAGRLVQPEDDDLRLLSGDFLYALGLSRLAALDDLEAVSELADLIALCAHVHASEKSGAELVATAAGVWAVCALGVGAGRWPEGEEAKTLARNRSAGGEQLLTAAAERARELGISFESNQALIAFKAIVSGDGGST
jgi:hypothetical protein